MDSLQADFASQVARSIPEREPKRELTPLQLRWLRSHIQAFADLEEATCKARGKAVAW